MAGLLFKSKTILLILSGINKARFRGMAKALFAG
jgi:hypothetical protein